MKTETYTVLDCREFDELVEQHLGIKRCCIRGQVQSDGQYNGIQQDFQANQDTYIILENEPEMWEEWQQNWKDWQDLPEPYDDRDGVGALSLKYAADLFQKGVFSPEHPVFVQVWW